MPLVTAIVSMIISWKTSAVHAGGSAYDRGNRRGVPRRRIVERKVKLLKEHRTDPRNDSASTTAVTSQAASGDASIGPDLMTSSGPMDRILPDGPLNMTEVE